ncbi:uncharacterized protein [Palaemon carinicauda]|uniref:uncharacterized protein n=1 Tax=Palaemon carinicauda TaxID=392227 RepID=UPI0035B69F90
MNADDAHAIGDLWTASNTQPASQFTTLSVVSSDDVHAATEKFLPYISRDTLACFQRTEAQFYIKDVTHSMTVLLPQYYEGQVMIVKVNLVAANGNFEFYLCPEVNPDDECLVRVPLRTEDFGKQFDLGEITIAGLYEILLRLPEGITCESSVLKWVISVDECSEENNDDCITLTDTVWLTSQSLMLRKPFL